MWSLPVGSMIRCYCGSYTTDAVFNLQCTNCGYFVHGACYKLDTGPILCGPCSCLLEKPCSSLDLDPWFKKRDQLSKLELERLQHQGLESRLFLALSREEHLDFLGKRTSLSLLYLRVKFDIGEQKAHQLLISSLEKGVFSYAIDGSLELDKPNLLMHTQSSLLNSQPIQLQAQPNLLHTQANLLQNQPNQLQSQPNQLQTLTNQRQTQHNQLQIQLNQLQATCSLVLDPPPAGFLHSQTNQYSPADKDGDSYPGNVTPSQPSGQAHTEPENMKGNERHRADRLNDNQQQKPFKGRDGEAGEEDQDDLLDLNSEEEVMKDDLKDLLMVKLETDVELSADEEGGEDDQMNPKEEEFLLSHRTIDHKDENQTCFLCHSLFKRSSELIRHLVDIHNFSTYKCEFCSFRAPKKALLKEHKLEKHSAKLHRFFYCDICDFKSDRQCNVGRHRRTQHESPKFSCDQCKYLGTSKSDLREHKKDAHKYIPCNLCDSVLRKNSILNRHMLKVHNVSTYECDQCDFKTSRQGNLNTHKVTEHGLIKEKKNFLCDDCGYSTNISSVFKRHRNSIHEQVKLKCDLCEYMATRQDRIDQHKRSVHEGLKYYCDQCSFETCRKDRLKVHNEIKHTGEKVRCRRCFFITTDQEKLEQHIQMKHLKPEQLVNLHPL